MASTANPVVPRIKAGVAPLRSGEGTSFLLRRLHSICGGVPIGAFLLEHFISNAEARRDTRWAMAPNPTRPNVFPEIRRTFSLARDCQSPCRV